MNFLKKILVGVILITFIIAAWTLIGRVNQIDQNQDLEIILDGKAYTELKALEPEISLDKLKASGLTTLAIYQQSLEELLEKGALEKVSPLNLKEQELKTELKAQGLNFKEFEKQALFAVFSDSLWQQLNNLAPDLAAEYGAKLLQTKAYNFLYFPNWQQKLADLNLAYNQELVEKAATNDLKLALRPNNNLNSFAALAKSLESIKAQFLIFDGEEITGYPAKIEETAALMKENEIIFAKVEAFIAAQKGAAKLAKLNNYHFLRTHSLQQDEVEQMTAQKIIERYQLAVRERNVKLLYYKPYLEGNQLVQKNLNLLESLSSNLKAEGYQFGNAKTAAYFSNSTWHLLAILLGVTAAGILLVNYFSDFKYDKLLNLLFFVALAAAWYFLSSGREILLRQILALGAAIIFPALAVIVFLLKKDRGAEEFDFPLNLSFLFCNFTAAVVTALIGGLFVSAALNSSDFIFKINNFRGVKLAFLIPLLIISAYYLLKINSQTLLVQIKEILETVIKVKHLVLAGFLLLIAIIYIGRTGNFPLLPVPAWELTIRSLLEKLLYVRPRFKEFLIGHPLFIFSLYLAAPKRKNIYFYPLLMLASVGLVTVVNTFSHLHTPVLVSLLRTFHAYWLSFLLAALVIGAYQLVVYLAQKYYLNGVKE
ncbi:MAG: DUF5693 family protein [Bacillota bacterium]